MMINPIESQSNIAISYRITPQRSKGQNMSSIHQTSRRNRILSIVGAIGVTSILATAVQAWDDNITYATVEEAAADEDFAFQGEYAGEDLGVQVIALGDGQFRAITYPGGLPGAGARIAEQSVTEGGREAIQSMFDRMKVERVERSSETIGLEAPEGAIVLFDGTQETLEAHWHDGARMTDDGLLMQGATTTDTFQDFTLHLEFLLPYMPKARGQGRSNSGMYLHGRYEVQILDSFGLEGLDNECGGIYSISRPDVNMCLPPLVWQTYDVEFTAARFDAAGNKEHNAHAVILHNGVVIHDRDLEHMTPGGPLDSESAEPGPLYLQDHGNPVRFRNIWVVPRVDAP